MGHSSSACPSHSSRSSTVDRAPSSGLLSGVLASWGGLRLSSSSASSWRSGSRSSGLKGVQGELAGVEVSLGPRVEPPEQKSGWEDWDSRVTAGIVGDVNVSVALRSQAELGLRHQSTDLQIHLWAC